MTWNSMGIIRDGKGIAFSTIADVPRRRGNGEVWQEKIINIHTEVKDTGQGNTDSIEEDLNQL